MKTTKYFDKIRTRSDRKRIKDEWVLQVMENPDKEIIQDDGRIRLWKKINEADNKYLRVFILEDRGNSA